MNTLNSRINEYLGKAGRWLTGFFARKWTVAVIIALLAAVLTITAQTGLGSTSLFSADDSVALDNIGLTAKNGRVVALADSSGERLIIAADRNGEYTCDATFFSGEDFSALSTLCVSNGGEVYACDCEYDDDGLLSLERIIRLSPDGGIKSVASFDYAKDIPAGNVCSMWIEGDDICFLYGGEDYSVWRLYADGRLEPIAEGLLVPEEILADLSSFSCEGGGTITAATGAGDVYQMSYPVSASDAAAPVSDSDAVVSAGDPAQAEKNVIPLEARLVFSSNALKREQGITSYPLATDISETGEIYFIDAADKSIKRVADGAPETVLPKMVIGEELPELAGWSGYYTFSVSDGGGELLTSCGNILLCVDIASGEKTISASEIRLAGGYVTRRTITWALMLIFAAACVYLLYYLLFVAKALKRLSAFSIRIILMVVGIVACSVAACIGISSEYIGYLESDLSNTIGNAALIASESFEGERLERLSDPSMYSSEEYSQLFDDACGQFGGFEQEWSKGYYTGFMFEKNGSVNVLFYTDGTYAPYLPLGFELDSQFHELYEHVADTGEAVVEEVEDYSGKYLYATTAIHNADGSTGGYLELGTFAGVFKQKLQSFAFDTAVTVIGLVAVLIFLFVEISFAAEVLVSGRKDKRFRDKDKLPRTVVRIPAFLSYFNTNILLYLMPIIMLKLAPNGCLGLSAEAAAALPLTLMMTGVLTASLASPLYMRLGWKNVTLATFGVTAASFLLLAFGLNPALLIVMAFFIGLANGASFMGLYEFIGASGKKNDQSTDVISSMNAGIFAGASSGVVAGTFLYSSVGGTLTFIFGSVVSALSLVFVLVIMPSLPRTEVEKTGRESVLRFVFRKETLFYGLFIIIPATVTTFFVLHFIPLYFEAQTLSAGLASLVYLLNGMMITFFGPTLTRTLVGRIGLKAAAVLSSVLAGAAIMLFSAYPVIWLAIIISLLLGLAEAFGQSTRIDYFSSTKSSLRYGKTESAGIYNVIEGISQLFGASIFSYIIAVGVGSGMLILGAVVIVMGGVYILLERYSRGK